MAKRAGSRPPLLRVRPEQRTQSPEAKPAIGSKPGSAPQPPLQLLPPTPSADAVLLFQRGMEALQRHAYTDGARAFQGILMGFPSERALAERATVYLALCERELNRRPAGPKTMEERLTAATAALNNDDDAGAEELARSVLGDDPHHDLALYLLAAIHARRQDHQEALALLGKVLAITPEASAQARADADFDGLHDLDAFWTLTEPPAGAAGPRRSQRPRRGR